MAGVSHGESNKVAFQVDGHVALRDADVFSCDGDRAALAHRIACVGGGIDDRHFELTDVHLHRPYIRQNGRDELGRAPEQTAQDGTCVLHGLAKVHDRRAKALLLRERQKLARSRFAPFCAASSMASAAFRPFG